MSQCLCSKLSILVLVFVSSTSLLESDMICKHNLQKLWKIGLARNCLSDVFFRPELAILLVMNMTEQSEQSSNQELCIKNENFICIPNNKLLKVKYIFFLKTYKRLSLWYGTWNTHALCNCRPVWWSWRSVVKQICTIPKIKWIKILLLLMCL